MKKNTKEVIKLSIFNLNLEGLHERSARKEKIIKIIKELKPDIITLQEAQQDIRFSKQNAVELLNEGLGYPFVDFQKCFNYSQDYGKGILTTNFIDEGLGVISKIAFRKKLTTLPIIKGIDRRPRIAVKYSFKGFNITNIHLSDKGSKSRKIEWKAIHESDIIVGGFNMQPEELATLKEDYISSYDISPYISYPSKNTTLDYCLLRSGKFKKTKVTTDALSDHAGIYREIEM